MLAAAAAIPQRPMRSRGVVVRGVPGKHLTEVSLTEDQHPVGDLGPHGQDEAFGEQFARGHRGGIVAVQPWWRDYAAAVMSGVRAGGSHAPVVNSWVIASRVSRPHLVAVDR